MLTISLLFQPIQSRIQQISYEISPLPNSSNSSLSMLLLTHPTPATLKRVYRSLEHQAYFQFQVLALGGFSIWDLFPKMFPWLTPSLYPGFCSDVISLRGFPDFYPHIFSLLTPHIFFTQHPSLKLHFVWLFSYESFPRVLTTGEWSFAGIVIALFSVPRTL